MSHHPLCSKLRSDIYCTCWERAAETQLAENKRLRAALRDIAHTSAATQLGVSWVHWAEQARRALAPASDEKDPSDA